MLEDAFNSIKAHLYDRAVSPLMGSIIVSWLAWNYKFPMLLISKEPILEKYRIINEVLYSTDSSIYLYGVLYPILTALAYIFIYPFPAEFVFKFTRNRQKSISNIKKYIEGETLLTVKESIALRREIDSLEDIFIADLEKRDAEIERLKGQLNSSNGIENNSHSASREDVNNITKPMELDDAEYEILQALEDSDFPESSIIRMLEGRKSSAWVKYHIEKLKRLGFISSVRDEFGDHELTITYDGRTHLINSLQNY
ncbi:hypothetical protein [Aeromonas caviae]|uniref:hypothetical protein n=1 Tax=Aeromonas caviae TaxID=648 RepID=UPI002B49BCBE|nr:hypothetical protein [Aeromonas caviae]